MADAEEVGARVPSATRIPTIDEIWEAHEALEAAASTESVPTMIRPDVKAITPINGTEIHQGIVPMFVNTAVVRWQARHDAREAASLRRRERRDHERPRQVGEYVLANGQVIA